MLTYPVFYDSIKEGSTLYTLQPRAKTIAFAIAVLVLSAFFYTPLQSIVSLSLKDDRYSHLLFMPLLALFFFIRDRKLFSIPEGIFVKQAAFFLIPAIIILAAAYTIPLNTYPIVKVGILQVSYLLFVSALLVFLYNSSIISKFKFPWVLMLFTIPVPTLFLEGLVHFFRYGSAEVVDLLFQLTGMNYIREGLTFHFPRISIFIAEECSGIRSSIALFITTLLAGQLLLKTVPAKLVLLIFVAPLTIIKNGIRITTLTILANKIDPKWLTDSALHHNGGIVFFGIILVLLFAILVSLQKMESLLTRKSHPETTP